MQKLKTVNKKIIKKLKIKIFADGANLQDFKKLNKIQYIKGFTTNPSLLKKNKIRNYKEFSIKVLKIIKKKPISFEVFSNNLSKIEIEAKDIASWGKNVYVKIPFYNASGKKTILIIKKLVKKNIPLNITAIFTLEQVATILKNVHKSANMILSIFSGRIADTGVDPAILVRKAVRLASKYKNIKILWASTREIFNIFEADKLSCHIITVPTDLIKKFNLIGKNLNSYSIETVKDFYNDSKSTKYKI
jgi:transaldolase